MFYYFYRTWLSADEPASQKFLTPGADLLEKQRVSLSPFSKALPFGHKNFAHRKLQTVYPGKVNFLLF